MLRKRQVLGENPPRLRNKQGTGNINSFTAMPFEKEKKIKKSKKYFRLFIVKVIPKIYVSFRVLILHFKSLI